MKKYQNEWKFCPAINKRKWSYANNSLFPDTEKMFDSYIKNFKHDGKNILSFENNRLQNYRSAQNSSTER